MESEGGGERGGHTHSLVVPSLFTPCAHVFIARCSPRILCTLFSLSHSLSLSPLHVQVAAHEEAQAASRASAADLHVNAVKAAEAQLLEARTAPLRAYLLSNVIPHVTAGLADVVKAGPGVDPVDHIAGFLLAVASQLEDSSRQQQAAAATAGATGKAT